MLTFLLKIYSIRFKLIVSLIAVSLLIGLISVLVGGNLLYQSVLDEANHRIRQDLNVARVIYDERVDTVRLALTIVAAAPEFKQAVLADDRMVVSETLGRLSDRLKLDFLGITDDRGRVINRYKNMGREKRSLISKNPFVLHVLEDYKPVAGTMVLKADALMAENSSLADLAHIIENATCHLNPGGRLMLEHGYAQGTDVQTLLKNNGFYDVSTLQDLSKHDRVTAGRIT